METKQRNHSFFYFIFLLLAAIFVITKMRRGFSGSEEAGGIWNVIQLLYVASGVVVLFSKEKTYKTFRCVRLYLGFSFYIWFLSLFPFLFSSMRVSQIFNFATVPYGVMVLILYYAVGRKAEIKQYWWVLMVAFYIIAAILFFAMRDFRVLSGDQGALADVYYVVTLLPLIMLYTSQKLKLVPFVVAFVVVAMTGKRGAFIAMGLIMVVYFLIPYAENGKNRKTANPLLRLIVFAAVFALLWFVINKVVGLFNLNIFERLDQMEEDGGSGRMTRWTLLTSLFGNESTIFEMLFGHGSGAAVGIIGGHAHNDFLEFFFDYGLFAGLLYVLFFVSIIREGIKMYKWKYPYAREVMCSVVIALCLSMFSFYAIDCTHITTSSICFGLILADWYKFKNISNEQQESNRPV